MPGLPATVDTTFLRSLIVIVQWIARKIHPRRAEVQEAHEAIQFRMENIGVYHLQFHKTHINIGRCTMRSKAVIVLLIFVLLLCAFHAFAQAQEEQPQLMMVWDMVVKPSMVNEFDAAVKNEVAFYAGYDFPYGWNVYSTNDYHYYFTMPVMNYTEIDKVHAAMSDLAEKAGDDYKKLMKQFEGTYDSMDMLVIRMRPDLSFVPANPLQPEEVKFLYWGFCYVIPGKEDHVANNFKKFVSLGKKHNFAIGWTTYSNDFGRDMPGFLYVETAKSATAFFSEGDKNREVAGDEIQELWIDTMKYFRKYELKMGIPRPELSYVINK